MGCKVTGNKYLIQSGHLVKQKYELFEELYSTLKIYNHAFLIVIETSLHALQGILLHY